MTPEEAKQLSRIHGSNLHQMHMSLEEVTSFIQTYTSWANTKIMFTKFPTLALLFNTNHGEDKMLSMGSTTIHQDFHEDGIPQLCEQSDSISQTKGYTGVCSRRQP
jgi:hypothetical protein